MAGCDQEVSGLPVLNNCPSGVEYVMLIGVPSLITPQNMGGYGLIPYNVLAACLKTTGSSVWVKYKIIVGHPELSTPGAPEINDGDTVFIVPYPIEKDSEVPFYQDVYIDPLPVGDDLGFSDIDYNSAYTVYTLSQPVTEYFKINYQAIRVLTSGGSNTGLQAVPFYISQTTNMIFCDFLGTFVSAIAGSISYDVNSVTQSGQYLIFPYPLDPQTITIFYYPSNTI